MKIIVIGSGVAGLAAATKLAKAGHQVTVIEKNEAPGGRISTYTQDGFTFDMGPTWYMMPEVFEDFWSQDLGLDIKDYLELKRLDPSYKLYYNDGTEIQINADLQDTISKFEQIEPGAGDSLKEYLKDSRYKYETALKYYVYKIYDNIFDFFNWRIISNAPRLHLFRSMHGFIEKRFKSKKLQQILEFMVVFIGGSPKNVPALYSLLGHADFNQGIWHPMGGMQMLADSLAKIGTNLGVEFIFDTPVTKIDKLDSGKKLVTAGSKTYSADVVVAAGDYQFMESLLDKQLRNYDDKYWNKLTLAPSTLLFYVGLDTHVPQIAHHTLFLNGDWDQHFEDIFKNPKWPTDPVFYTCVANRSDPSLSPQGKDGLTILIPLAPDLEDTLQLRDEYFSKAIAKISEATGVNLADKILFSKSFGIDDFKSRYNAFKGNAFGLAHSLFQTAVFRPNYRNKNIPGLYYTGQFTIPGVGVPMALISGKIIADQILEDYK